MKANEFITEIKKGQKDSNGYTRCWPGKHAEGTKKGKNGGQVRNCVPNEGVAESGAETSWSNDTDTITLQDILELTKHIKQINLPINDNLKSKLLHWKGNPEEIERVNQVTVSNQFPILIMVDEQGQIEWILDGNHRLHKAIQSQAKTIPAKLIRPNNLNDKAKKIFNIKEQGVAEGMEPIGGPWKSGEFSRILNAFQVYTNTMGYGMEFYNWANRPQALKLLADKSGTTPELVKHTLDSLNWGQHPEEEFDDEEQDIAEEFDLIESIINDLAEHNGVDAEVIWEDLESLTDDELYVFATTTTIMETEAWQKANNKDRTNGMSRKAVKAYRREHPGSKLQTAVTTKPSKLKKGSKASKRRKSYCSRSRGQMKMHNISCAKTPDKAICKARRRWNC